MHPIFFSTSAKDVVFAEKVWLKFGSDLIYLYSKTGRQGAEFWEEIEREELPNARAIVLFWSRAFVSSPGTQREIALAAKMLRTGQLRSAIVLRVDDCPLLAPDDEQDRDVRKAYEDLRPFLDLTRASDTTVSVDLAASLCDDLVARFVAAAPPVFARPMLEEEFFRQARLDQRHFRPMVWVSGLNGNGRRTLIREAYRRIDANALAIEVDISECSIPKQLVLRLESEAFHCPEDRLRQINAAPGMDTAQAVASVLQRIRQSGRYTILKQQRLVDDRVALPEWLVEVAMAIDLAPRPAVFVVSPVPVAADSLRTGGDHLGAVRVPAFMPQEAEEFSWSLVRHFDPQPVRWSDDLVRRVSRESGGTPELMAGIVRLGSRLADLEPLRAMLSKEVARFSESLTNFVDWAVLQLAAHPDALRVLRMLQDVSPATIELLREMLGSTKPLAHTVGALLTVGLIECTESGLYRLSPLLARRLDRHLIEPDLLAWHRSALRHFVDMPRKVTDADHGYVRIEATMNAALRFGPDAVPDSVREFVSAAHWFQAGVRLYAARHYRDAHSLLVEAFEFRSTFGRTARTEVCRYLGLAAVRVHHPGNIAAAIAALLAQNGGQELVDYLRGFEAEMSKHFLDAIGHYSDALRAAQAHGSRDWEARILRPLINCILRMPRPDFKRGEQLAYRAVEINRTVFSLLNHAKVLVNRCYRDPNLDDTGKDQVWERYLVALEALENHPGSASACAEVRADEAELTDEWDAAVQWMNQAIDADPRFENRLRRWKIMIRSKSTAYCREAIDEIQRVFVDSKFKADVTLFKVPLVEALAMAQKVLGHPGNYSVDQYGQGLGSTTKARIIREVQRLDPGDATFMADVE